mmetsp:Transcript_34138/g.105983  ORF Transcript_34138/g.105983 Transcript_34138/m.105983 type:complete len:216 (-) Transcript_34138:285-932(-)
MDQRLQEVLFPPHPLQHLRLRRGQLLHVRGLVGVLYKQLKAPRLDDVEPAAVRPAVHDLRAGRNLFALAGVADLLHQLLAESHQRPEVGVPPHGVRHEGALLAVELVAAHPRARPPTLHPAWPSHSAAAGAPEVPPQVELLELARRHGQRHEARTGNDLAGRPLRQQGVAEVVSGLEPYRRLVAVLLGGQLHLGPSLSDQEELRTALAGLQHDLA